ncbi:MAG TPA: homoserine dehydrogenase, partial [Paraburkholderia sp.]
VAEFLRGLKRRREVEAALANGKSVVTANKALLARHGASLARAAEAAGATLAFEASVCGGIPIIKGLREGLAANRITELHGILNGTCNYILSQMRDTGRAFEEVLAEAQALGYAEADPSFDIDGIDTAHKLAILTAVAFGTEVDLGAVHIEGIRHIGALDITYADELGYAIKLLGIARRTDRGIELRVHPTLIPGKRLLANVEGPMNAVVVQGDAVGATLYYGKGAGAEPTASAVVADLVDVTRLHTADPEHRVPHLAFQPDSLSNTPILPIDEVTSGYYLRLRVADETGVMANITRILADGGISIDALLQKESAEVDAQGKAETDVILITHETVEKNVNAAIVQIEQLATVVSSVTKLRMEALN